jgi:AcrR family transcriptional regulator
MDNDSNSVRSVKLGRPRSEKSHRAILDATLELLAEQGFDGLSIEGVADRAGVGKTTIYRRWANKEALVSAALQDMRSSLEMPQPGRDLHETVVRFFEEFFTLLQERPVVWTILIRLLGEAQEHPDIVRDFYTQIYARVGLAREYVDSLKATGEIDPDLDWPMAASLIAGPLLYLLVLNRLMGEPEISRENIEKYTDVIVRAVRKPVER